jgi:hypothetical protein
MLYNRTDRTETEIREYSVIWWFYSGWRERKVTIYADPLNEDRVYTIGECDNGDIIICHEALSDYRREIQGCLRETK